MIKTFTLFGITDVGRQRSHNEDNFVVARDVAANAWGFRRSDIVPAGEAGALLVVADGMGGTNAGEVASHLAQEYVQEAFQQLTDVPGSAAKREAFLRDCIIKAHERIVEHQHANLDTAGMGTTLVIAWVIGNQLHTAWSGDSRCYVYTPGEPLLPFTDDHSMVWDLVKKGKLSAEEARTHPESNLILQSLGSPEQPPKPSSRSTTLYSGDRVLVCSDGLNGMLPDQRIEQVLSENKGTADTCAELVEHANRAGGEDNITCLLLDVVEADERPGAGAAATGKPDNVAQTVRRTPPTTAKNPGLPHLDTTPDSAPNPDENDEAVRTNRKGSVILLIVVFLLLAGGSLAYLTFFNNDDVQPDQPEEIRTPDTAEASTDTPDTDNDTDSGNRGSETTPPNPATDSQRNTETVTPPQTDENTESGSIPSPDSNPGSGAAADDTTNQPEADETVPPTPSEPSFRVPTDDQSEDSGKPESGEAEPEKNPDPDSTEQAGTDSLPSVRLPAIMNPAGSDTTSTPTESPSEETDGAVEAEEAEDTKPAGSEPAQSNPPTSTADSTSQTAENPAPKPQI